MYFFIPPDSCPGAKLAASLLTIHASWRVQMNKHIRAGTEGAFREAEWRRRNTDQFKGPTLATPGPSSGSHVLNLSSKMVFCFAHSLLEPTQKLILFALRKSQILISQLTILLFEFAFNFVPVPLQLQLYNTSNSCVRECSALLAFSVSIPVSAEVKIKRAFAACRWAEQKGASETN
jgi:hypothetical protein